MNFEKLEEMLLEQAVIEKNKELFRQKADELRTKAFFQAMKDKDKVNALKFLEKGICVNALNEEGQTPLMMVASCGEYQMAEKLIKEGAQVDYKGKNGWTALMLAAYFGCENISELLLENKADVNLKNDDGATALMLAVKEGYFGVSTLLVQQGAQINIQNKYGQHLIMPAIAYEYMDILKLLIEKDSSVLKEGNLLKEVYEVAMKKCDKALALKVQENMNAQIKEKKLISKQEINPQSSLLNENQR